MTDDRAGHVAAGHDEPSDGTGRLVAWEATARRLRRAVLVLAGLAVAGWTVTGVLGGDWSLRTLANWVGIAVLVLFVVEVVVVGGSAARGLLRAGERGERLSGSDVGLLPPTRGRAQSFDDA